MRQLAVCTSQEGGSPEAVVADDMGDCTASSPSPLVQDTKDKGSHPQVCTFQTIDDDSGSEEEDEVHDPVFSLIAGPWQQHLFGCGNQNNSNVDRDAYTLIAAVFSLILLGYLLYFVCDFAFDLFGLRGMLLTWFGLYFPLVRCIHSPRIKHLMIILGAGAKHCRQQLFDVKSLSYSSSAKIIRDIVISMIKKGRCLFCVDRSRLAFYCAAVHGRVFELLADVVRSFAKPQSDASSCFSKACVRSQKSLSRIVGVMRFADVSGSHATSLLRKKACLFLGNVGEAFRVVVLAIAVLLFFVLYNLFTASVCALVFEFYGIYGFAGSWVGFLYLGLYSTWHRTDKHSNYVCE
jgi:hypothetical protein